MLIVLILDAISDRRIIASIQNVELEYVLLEFQTGEKEFAISQYTSYSSQVVLYNFKRI